MADVRLLYPSDKIEAAARLADAIGSAGYTVDREKLTDSQGFPSLAAEARKAKVLLLIWSRGLVSATMAEEGLAEARRQPNLVEVSADGIEPALGGDASPVVLLCGWRGQPFHPGWQRILAEIKRLCGARMVAAKSPRPVPSGDPAKGPAGAAPRPASRRPAVRAAVAAGALIAVTLGAAAALERRAPDAAPTVKTGASADDPENPVPSRSAGPAAVTASAAPIDAVTGISPPAAATGAEAVSPPTLSAVRPAPRKAAAQRSKAKRFAAAPDREVKRYSRKNSKTMRLFCQRSGRSTPQCRTFARSMGDRRG